MYSNRFAVKNFAIWLFQVIVFSKLQARLESPLFEDNIIIAICGLLFIVICILDSQGRFSKKNIILYGILICYALLFALVFKNKVTSIYVNKHFVAFLGFLIIVIGVVGYFKNRTTEEIWSLIKCTYLTIFLFLLVCYVLYFDGFEVLRNPMLLLESDWRRTRSLFGFTHANTTAAICITCFYLRLLIYGGVQSNYIKISKITNLFYNISIIIVFIMLISTASRGTIIALVSLYCFRWYSEVDDKFYNKKIIKVLKPVVLFLVVGIVILAFYYSVVRNGIFDISYRLENFTANIPTLIRENRLLTGFGFMDKAMFAREKLISGTGYTDNYFLYVLVSTGIIGICFNILFIIRLLNGFRYTRNRLCDNSMYRIIVSVFVSQMVLSFSEAEFLNPASPNAMICLIVYGLYYACGLYGRNYYIAITKKVY